MADNDEELFLQEMQGVTPLPVSDRVTLRSEQQRDQPGQLRRRLAASGVEGERNPLTIPDAVKEVGPLDIVGEKKNGVQEGVYRKLRLGKYEPGDHLDLHRVKIRDAAAQVQSFLLNAHRHNFRTVLITHGKGVHSAKPGVMKSYVMHWLRESELVLAWHSAQAKQGGTGATYVLVRKSGEACKENREQFNRGG